MATEFPCKVCIKECGFTGTIRCGNCKDWIHKECLERSEEELKGCSSATTQFLCKRCAFVDGESDSEMSVSSAVNLDKEDSRRGNLNTGTFMDTKDVLHKLLNSDQSFDHVPGGVKENVYFVVKNCKNLEKRTQNSRSSFPDDCGVWNTSAGASPKSYYMLLENGEIKKTACYKGEICNLTRLKNNKGAIERKYIPMDPQPEKKNLVVIHRYYTTLKSSSLYKKRVTWLGEGGLQSNLAVVEYVGAWPGLIPHGNAKGNNGYARVPAHVMDEISECLNKDTPSSVFDHLKSKSDQFETPEASQVLCDKKKNNKKKGQNPCVNRNNVADDFQQLKTMVYENDCFVREIVTNSGKLPCVTLYTNEQLEDIKNLCCTGQTVIEIDKIVDLTNYYVTIMSYKQLTVTRIQTGEHPLFIGPMFIHNSCDFETYAGFFFHLRLKLHGTDTSKLIFGSNEEKAMVKALMYAFNDATQLLCGRHLNQNVERKLLTTTVGFPDRNTILGQVFGSDGVIDADLDDTACFEEKFDQVEEYCSDLSTNVEYFRNKTPSQLEDKVNQPTRLELIAEGWANNSESISDVLKRMIDHRTKPLTDLVELLRNKVNGQFEDIKSALLQTGELRLAESHKQFEVTKETWIRKTVEQRDELYKQMRQHVKTDAAFVISTDGRTKVVAPREKGRKPGQCRTNINEQTTTSKRRKTAK